MTQEEKQLLLTDLCARLPHGITIYRITDNSIHRIQYLDITENIDQFSHFLEYSGIDNIKPYLRSLSNMTEDEAMKIVELCVCNPKDVLSISIQQDYISIEIDDGVAWSETYTLWFSEIVSSIKVLDFLNAHQFDYRGLIPKGLALEAHENMYDK